MLELLNRPEFVVFTTRSFANAGSSSPSTASRRLDRLAGQRFLTRITKGVWANTSHPHFHPLACVPHLLGREQGYVSFLAALRLHGVISQIPRSTQVATTGRGRVHDSPVGRFEFFRIKPELMHESTGWSDTRLPYQVATREKAMLEVLYLSTRKNRRFARLPEVDLAGSRFREQEFERLLARLAYPASTRSAIQTRWQALQALPS